MHYHAVVDRFPVPIPLDPIAAGLFTVLFIAVALAVSRRPALGVAALVLTAPFAFAHEIVDTSVTLPKVVLLAMLAGLTAHPKAFAVLRRPEIRPVLLAVCAMIGAIVLSGLHALHLAPVVSEALKWLEYLLAIGAVVVAYRVDPDDTLIRRAWMLAIAAVCASALVQEVIGAPSGLRIAPSVVPRIAGVIEGPNQLAGYLEVAIAVAAAWTIARTTLVAQTVLGVAIFTLALTFSRAGFAGDLAGLATLALVYGRDALRAVRPVAAGIVLGLGADLAWFVAAKTLAVLRAPEIGADYAGGVGSRAELWRAALFFFRSHPWLGIGAGNYEFELASAGVVNVRTHANEWYLQQLAEGGVILFAATIAFIATTLRALLRNVRSSPWTAAGLAATVAMCAHQLGDFIVFYPKAGLPWMIAIALGIAALRERQTA